MNRILVRRHFNPLGVLFGLRAAVDHLVDTEPGDP